jgi:translocation and assembly module TamB
MLDGPIGNPTYNGELSLVPGGTLFFRDTPFNIETGNIRFRNTKKMNPSFYVDASTSILEQSSQTNYDVNIAVRGNLENFTTKLDSQPVLSETDLISLLALGLTSEQLDKQSVENQRDLQMMEIGAAVISNSPLGKELKDRTGFTFKLSTDIDEKDSTQYKVVISKKVTPKMEASASILGNNAKKDVRLEYKLNKDLSLVGSWESTTFDEASDTSIDQEQKSDILGLDLRYKVEFK